LRAHPAFGQKLNQALELCCFAHAFTPLQKELPRLMASSRLGCFSAMRACGLRGKGTMTGRRQVLAGAGVSWLT
jgi:hypothetical protein